MRTILLTAALLWPVVTQAAPPAAGLIETTIPAPHHERHMDLALWYPARADAPRAAFAGNPVFRPVAVARDAAALPGPHPVVLLSHGLGGHHRSLAWLAAGLARAGAVVVAVNHPNSTHGDFDLAAGMAHWTRAADLSAALDHAAADPRFGPLLDPSRVAVVGFSYGGWTALQLGGLRGHLAGFAAHCADNVARDRHCADLAAAGVDLSAFDPADWDAQHRDPRVRAVVAIDPGLTWRLDPAHAAEFEAAALLIQLGDGQDRLPATDLGPGGSGLTALLPGAQVVGIAPAHHVSVLPLCTDIGAALLAEEGDDPVCTDPPGADRAAIHAQVLGAVVAFLDLN